MRRVVIGDVIQCHVEDHLSTALIGAHFIERFFFAIQHANAGRPIKLVTRYAIKVAIQILNIDRYMHRTLRPINHHFDAARFGIGANRFDINHGAHHIGHVGDGNFHATPLVMMEDPEEVARAETMIERLNYRAIAMGGTCTGEHGIGMGKMDFLEAELGGAVDVMKSIKMALDPDNLMNPGKIFQLNG